MITTEIRIHAAGADALVKRNGATIGAAVLKTEAEARRWLSHEAPADRFDEPTPEPIVFVDRSN